MLFFEITHVFPASIPADVTDIFTTVGPIKTLSFPNFKPKINCLEKDAESTNKNELLPSL